MLFDTTVYRNSIATNYNSMNERADVRENVDVCDQIQSVTIAAPPESTGVTTFVQEACTAISAVDSSFSNTFYPVQSELQDVREYFRRPVAISVGTVASTRSRFFSANGTFTDFLNYWVTPQARLLGAYGIRAKMVLTLQVAATPFHQGLVCLSGQYGYVATSANYDRSFNSNTATNLPCVILDLSNDTSVQLHLPYLYVAEYSQIRPSNGESNYIQLALNTLTSVPAVAGMGSPTYQLFLHLEDIELFGATPQAVSTVVLTAGRKLSPVTEEFERDSHPFSSALHASSRAISFIAKGVPSLSSIGGPVSWALGKAAGVVRYFGYGKPAVIDPVMRVVRMDNVGEFNTDVATSSMVVAATAANTTSVNTHVGYSDVDEMALSYVTSRWGQLNYFEIPNSVAAGTLVYGTPICPLAFWFRAKGTLPASNIYVGQFSTATSNAISPTHIMFAASSFKQWRGGLKFRFTFAKTKMHAGRVMVNFNPYLDTVTNTARLTGTTSVSLANYGSGGPDPFGYSAVFDLKDGNVFEFKIPYVCSVPYANLAASTGALSMYVVNPVISSSVVSSTIGVLVEIAGDSDFELANPTGVMFNVHNAGTIRLNAGRVLSEAPEIVNQLTMGESITSVKQLISIPHVSYVTNVAGDQYGELVPPWYYQPTPSVLVPAPTAVITNLAFSYGGNWASCYAFMKGGTDLHVYDVAETLSIYVSQLPNSGGYIPNTVTPDHRSSSNTPAIFSSVKNLHARLPGFFPTARVNTYIANGLTASGVSWNLTNPYTSTTTVKPYDGIQALYNLHFQPNAGGAGSGSLVYINRNASDDAQLAMYMGPPPVFLPPGPVANGQYDVDSLGLQDIS